jgi:hypothetical protein
MSDDDRLAQSIKKRTADLVEDLPLDALATAINIAHNEATAAAVHAIRCAIEAGRFLLQAKSKLPHGEFGPWLATNCKVGHRQARRYMRHTLQHLATSLLHDGGFEVSR